MDVSTVLLLFLVIALFKLLSNKRLLVLLANQVTLLKRYSLAFKMSADSYLILDQAGKILEGNASLAKMIGYSEEEITTFCFSDFFSDWSPNEVNEYIARNMIFGKSIFATNWRRKDGEIINVEVGMTSVQDVFFCSIRDVSERKQFEEKLKESEGFLEIVLDAIPDSLVLVDTDGQIVLANPATYDLYEIPYNHSLPKREDFERFFKFTDAKGRVITSEEWPTACALRGEVIGELELCVTRQDTGKRWVGLYWALPIYYKEKYHALVGVKDITGRRCAEIALEEARVALQLKNEKLSELNRILEDLSSLDGLTAIPNRRRFDEYLIREWHFSLNDRVPLSMIVIDIDHFKLFNENYGYIAGDDCLRTIARTLKTSLIRASDLVARYGGEEFACILPNTDSSSLISIGNQLKNSVSELSIPHEFSRVAKYVTISLGGATIMPSEEVSPYLLIGKADSCLYRAKAQGRNQFVSMSE
ncbi:putative Diguanylate cyclase [Gammaproteobacteria bacterium]